MKNLCAEIIAYLAAKRQKAFVLAAFFLCFISCFSEAYSQSNAGKDSFLLNDSHFHLTNYVQEGTDIHKFLTIMGNKVGRVALFGIPLQQMWNSYNTGNVAPTYYLGTDDPLYYYSFTDAYIAMAYRSLTEKERQRFDPMITGFNPADMYAADHIKRVLLTFPGVFTGIGEFSIHKEFVSSKISGPHATLNNPALDRILDFCAETGLLVILHNDIDMPFPKDNSENWDLAQLRELFKRHSETTIIWAHCGVGRIVRPVKDQLAMIDKALNSPDFNHVYIDISWTEVAKYVTETPEATTKMADVINKYPDRFLMGTDEVAPADQASYLKIMDLYKPLLQKLTSEAKQKLLKGNYQKLFDAARLKVRAWENQQLKQEKPASSTAGPGINTK